MIEKLVTDESDTQQTKEANFSKIIQDEMPRDIYQPLIDTLSVPMPSSKFEAHGGSYGTTAHFEKTMNNHIAALT